MTMPRYLQTMLISKGVMDTDRVSARPTTRTCKSCGHRVIAALADDGPSVAGTRVNLHPRPLTPYGELLALTAGLLTFMMRGGLVGWRDPITIRRLPADKADVFTAHRCEMPVLEYAAPPTPVIAETTDPSVIPS